LLGLICCHHSCLKVGESGTALDLVYIFSFRRADQTLSI
jgi:hypothetical protein